ncbi:MAG: transposase [Planctomycetota bacterium]
MPRRRRRILPEVEHHVTQRAAHGRFILQDVECKAMLMSLLIDWSERLRVMVSGFVLMDNHFHLSARPPDEGALGFMMGRVTADFSRWFNAGLRDVGPNWQGPFYAAPMDELHAVMSLRYIERNPVEAGLCTLPWEYQWSSAAFHAGLGPRPNLLSSDIRPSDTTPCSWREILIQPTSADADRRLEECSLRGNPFADASWIERIEAALGRRIRPGPVGRPRAA